MKLVSLNTWGGKLLDPLLKFIGDYSNTTDIFCFQEVYRAPFDKIIAREMHSNIYGKMVQVLTKHQGYFALHLKETDLGGRIDFPLEYGLAIFINKRIKVNECKDIFIYREGFKLLNNDIATVPRNLQYISFIVNKKNYLVGSFHGIWYPKTKVDTEDRIKQSQKIKDFLSKRNEVKILCGDFNLLPNTQSMKNLEVGMRNLITEYKIPTTRNKYYGGEEKHADYILVSPDVRVKQFRVIDITVSDHLPLMLEFV